MPKTEASASSSTSLGFAEVATVDATARDVCETHCPKGSSPTIALGPARIASGEALPLAPPQAGGPPIDAGQRPPPCKSERRPGVLLRASISLGRSLPPLGILFLASRMEPGPKPTDAAAAAAAAAARGVGGLANNPPVTMLAKRSLASLALEGARKPAFDTVRAQLDALLSLASDDSDTEAERPAGVRFRTP